ncbi:MULTISPECIES: hypothetical protein [unclassified Romboutsia]|uniref:hypothetical protein n=1 Tax=unclassified Romboutsia TaxID=2626894 RepID=UPI0008232C7A|nr:MULTISPECIES: hypothetical protein [unclassified Romboutsia]SCH44087.1 Apolipoprotein A1/A4/E domain [uncultured Clostridium sp.]
MEQIVTIVFALLVVWIVYKFLKDKQYSNESSLGNIASTIGVLGTFVGISIGLWKFDPSNISESVPMLLTGMKIAFATSIVGMSAAIFMKYTALKHEDDENIDDIMELFNTMINESRAVNNTLIENQKNTELVFNKISEVWISNQSKFTSDISNEILKLNNNTISKQNELIDEFKKLGETFKILNNGVENLLSWQENYKNTIEMTTKELNTVVKSITYIDDSIKDISQNSLLIKENNENLSDILRDIKCAQSIIVDGTKSIISISQKAEQSIPLINSYFENIDTNTNEAVNNLQGSLYENIHNVEAHLENIVSEVISKVEENKNIFNEEVKNYISEFKKMVYDINLCIPEISNSLQRSSDKFNNELSSFTREIQNALQENYNCINHQVNNLKKSTISINNNLDNTISQSTKRLENMNIATQNQIKIMVEDMEDIFTRKIEHLDNTLEIELEKSLNSLGKQLATISNRFAKDYIPLADKLKDVVKIAEGVR